MSKYIIIFISLFFLSGCDAFLKFSGFTHHIYQNVSNHKVQLKSYNLGTENSSFTLLQGEEIIFKYEGSEGEDNPPFDLPRYVGDDSVVIVFDDTLSIMYDKGRINGNPMIIENYELIEGEKEPYIYLFEFTNEDYQRALDRGRIINNYELRITNYELLLY